MDNFIEAINPAYCFVMAGILLVMFGINVYYFVKSKNMLCIIIGVLSFGLFYDMLITGLGSTLYASSAFYPLSYIRHVLHSLITPMLFIFVLQVFRDCGKLKHKRYTYITLGIVAFLVISGIVSIITSPTYIKAYGGVTQMSMDKTNATAFASFILNFMSFGTLIPMIAGSIVSIMYQKDYNLCIATVAMTILSGVGAALLANTMFVPSFIGEACIAIFFFKYIYDQHITTNNTTAL